MAYKFIKTSDEDGKYHIVDIEYSINDNNIALDQLLEEFQNFLKACTFGFKDNEYIGIIEEN